MEGHSPRPLWTIQLPSLLHEGHFTERLSQEQLCSMRRSAETEGPEGPVGPMPPCSCLKVQWDQCRRVVVHEASGDGHASVPHLGLNVTTHDVVNVDDVKASHGVNNSCNFYVVMPGFNCSFHFNPMTRPSHSFHQVNGVATLFVAPRE